MSNTGVIAVRLSDIQQLPDNERRILRSYIAGGGKLRGYLEARYRDEPEVRRIFTEFHINALEAKTA